MTRWRRCLAAMAVLLLAAPVRSQQPPPAPGPAPAPEVPAAAPSRPAAAPELTAADLSAWLDGFMPNALKGGRIAGAQVTVVRDGRVLLNRGYGYADVAAKSPMDPERTLMRIGSTSKLFTWTAVMQLVERGRIDLNADINRYLDFRIEPKGGRPVTMNDVMRHRGGFQEGIKDIFAGDLRLLKTNERYLKENRPPMLFPAGEVPAYSNYATALAGYVVSRVSGEPFDDYVERHILRPLGMNRTTFRQPLPRALADSLSRGYRASDGPAEPFELVGTAPAGSASTTGADMARFMLAHLGSGPPLLRPETMRLMHSPAVAPERGFDTMAHGFFRSTRNGRLVLGHGGDTVLFHTDLNLLPDEGVGLYVSFNSRGRDDAAYGARERLFDLFLDRYFPAPPTRTPPAIAGAADHARALAGRYESSRRVETGFISLFYLLQQSQVVAHPDGTIGLDGGEERFREVAPGLWRQVDGARLLRVTAVGGRRTILDGSNPISVLQAVPAARNAGLFQLVCGLSILTLLAAVVAWPVGWRLRRAHGVPPIADPRRRRAALLTRLGALGDLLYLAGWYALLAPILSLRLGGYNQELDGTIRLLQLAGAVPVLAALAGAWNAVLTVRAGDAGWGAGVRSVLVALALTAFLWAAWMGELIGWGVMY